MMKNRTIITMILVVSLITIMAGCAAGAPKPVRNPHFVAHYIRTNGYHSDVIYPVVSIIRTRTELMDYYDKNKDRYDLDRRSGPVPSDATIGFLDAGDKYDVPYFENNMLILLLVEEGSGSIRHEVKDFVQEEQSTQVLIERQIPEVGTADMAEWHIVLELEKKDFRDQSIKVVFSDAKA